MEKELQTAIECLKQKVPGLIAIVIFGSYGTQYQTAHSDLDLAILAPLKLDAVALWQLAQNIAIKINRDVDLIDLKQASTVFAFEILSFGRIIFCSDSDKFAIFDNTAISMYLRFQGERMEILQDYANG